jgi:DNA-directed RNA polymerase subunit RPC12/RpoP
MYKCMNSKCGKMIEDNKKKIRCPFCGYRVFVKVDALPNRKIRAR